MFTGLHRQPRINQSHREHPVVSAPAHHHIHGNMRPGEGAWIGDGRTGGMRLAVSNTGISDLVSLDGQRPLGYAHHPSGESASDQLWGSTPGTLYDRICVWGETLPLTHAPHYSSFSGWHHFGTHPLVFVSLSGHRGVQRVYQLPSEFLRSCLYLHADVHHSHSFSGEYYEGSGWDKSCLTWRATSSTSRITWLSLCSSLGDGRRDQKWFSWEPPWLFCTSFLTSLYHQFTLGPERKEEGGGGKLWLILLWRQPKGEEHSGCGRNHHKRGLLGGVNGGGGVQVMFQEEGLPWRELLVHLPSW